MENSNIDNNSQDFIGTSNPFHCPGENRQRHSLASNAIDWNITPAERVQLAELDAEADIDDTQLMRDLAGVIAAKAGASPAMVFACKVMGTVLTEDYMQKMSFEDHHRVAEAIALFETYGEMAWCFIED